MIGRIIESCLNNRLLVIFFTLLLIVAGIWALKKTPIDAIPDIGENQTIVYADCPGRSPQDVEDQVTYPLTVNLMVPCKLNNVMITVIIKPITEIKISSENHCNLLVYRCNQCNLYLYNNALWEYPR